MEYGDQPDICHLKITNSLAILRLRKPLKTSTRLAGHGIWTQDLPNASLVRYHGATSLGLFTFIFKECVADNMHHLYLSRNTNKWRHSNLGLCIMEVGEVYCVELISGVVRITIEGQKPLCPQRRHEYLPYIITLHIAAVPRETFTPKYRDIKNKRVTQNHLYSSSLYSFTECSEIPITNI